jgi:hypothetical protein
VSDDETKTILGTQLQIWIGDNEIHKKRIYSQELNAVIKSQNIGAAQETICTGQNWCDLEKLLTKYRYYKTWMANKPAAENMNLAFFLFVCYFLDTAQLLKR